MECFRIKRRLPLFLDGQLNEDLALKIKQHLEECQNCSNELKRLKESWDLLAEWRTTSPSPNFKAKFWQRAAQEEAAPERKPVFALPRLKPQLIPAFATLAVIVIIGVHMMNTAGPKNIQQITLATKDEDVLMLKELALSEDLEIIENLDTLEDLEIVESIKI